MRTGFHGQKWNGRGRNGWSGQKPAPLFRESNCVLCLMFSPTQRPTTAYRSGHVVAGPRGIRMCATCTLTLYCDAIQTPRGQECNIALSLQSLHSARYGSRAGQGACKRSQAISARSRPVLRSVRFATEWDQYALLVNTILERSRFPRLARQARHSRHRAALRTSSTVRAGREAL